jgi:hypothetical protein
MIFLLSLLSRGIFEIVYGQTRAKKVHGNLHFKDTFFTKKFTIVKNNS